MLCEPKREMWSWELVGVSCVLRQLRGCREFITCEGIATRKVRWTTSHLAKVVAFGIVSFEIGVRLSRAPDQVGPVNEGTGGVSSGFPSRVSITARHLRSFHWENTNETCSMIFIKGKSLCFQMERNL